MSSAEERKRKRLDAWRKKQQIDAAAAAPAKVSLSLGGGGLAALAGKKKKKKRGNAFAVPKSKNKKANNPFFADDEGDSGASDKEDDDDDDGFGGKPKLLTLETLTQPATAPVPAVEEEGPPRKRSRGRWDKKSPTAAAAEQEVAAMKQSHDDALDKFMEKLEAGALGNVTTQRADEDGAEGLKINVSGSMIPHKSALLLQQTQQNPVSGSVTQPLKSTPPVIPLA